MRRINSKGLVNTTSKILEEESQLLSDELCVEAALQDLLLFYIYLYIYIILIS